MEKYAKRFTKQEKSWILYDWANSVYATNIMAAIFPIYFGAVCESAGVDNVQVWGYGTSAATLVVAVMGPVLGAVGDHKGMKKKLFTGFLAAGVLFTLMMAVFDQWQLLLAGYVISYIGFAGSCLFYDSFLTDVTTEERMDRVSSWGYAMGYIGGSTIPFVISIAVLLIMGMDNPAAVKFSVVITSVWWLIFSIPILKNVNQTHYIEAPASKLLSHTFQSLKKTLREIFRNKTIFIFIIAYFFYIDGVGTVIHMATSYGTNLGLDTTGMIIALLVTQIVAMPCSILFGRASGKFSSIKLILFAIAMYLVICVLGFYMGFHVERAFQGRRPSGLSKRPSLFPDPFLDHGGAGRYGSGGRPGDFPFLFRQAGAAGKIQRVFRLFRYFWKICHSYGPGDCGSDFRFDRKRLHRRAQRFRAVPHRRGAADRLPVSFYR